MMKNPKPNIPDYRKRFSDKLDLSPLKELTNSPIGGDGVYPDGPEVLAINVRLRNGTANGTILLRWSEAQA